MQAPLRQIAINCGQDDGVIVNAVLNCDDEDYGYGTDEYSEMLLQLQNEHEFEMANLNSWESQLDIEKENLENQLNEIQSYETTWQKILQANIKNDFSYGGVGGGK